MTKNILEWGWHTSSPNSSSSDSEWKPATTLLGGGDPDPKVAAVGDLKCEGSSCTQGGSRGTTAGYRVFGPAICRDCAPANPLDPVGQSWEMMSIGKTAGPPAEIRKYESLSREEKIELILINFLIPTNRS